jgi:predicted Zn-dependent protease with MMP-like domain
VERDAFEQLVGEAMETLPAALKQRIDNVGVEVMQLAPADVAESVGRHPWTLLGVYQGVPFNRRGPWYGNVLPDRILIFQKPIERLCRTSDDVRRLVRKVVIHEVGHYFGLNDEELRRLEKEAGPGPGPAS